MLSPQSLLALLADGQWLSGEALGETFDVSRTAIWKQLKHLKSAGIEIESERGKGYRLLQPMQLLADEHIKSRLSSHSSALLQDLSLAFSVDSTNIAMMQRVEMKDALSGSVMFAEQQTAGRGRRGRSWVSPLGRNIYCSIVWRFATGAAALSGLSLAVGVASVKALESLGYQGVELKWPNDLLWQGRKLGGILLEMSGDAAGPCHVVVGIGLNLTMSEIVNQSSGKPDMTSDISQDWVDLREIGQFQVVDKNAVAAALLDQLLPMLDEFESLGFSYYLPQWQARDAFIDRDVEIHLSDEQVISGCYKGVATDGGLIVQTAEGEQRLHGGEISLRASSENMP